MSKRYKLTACCDGESYELECDSMIVAAVLVRALTDLDISAWVKEGDRMVVDASEVGCEDCENCDHKMLITDRDLQLAFWRDVADSLDVRMVAIPTCRRR